MHLTFIEPLLFIRPEPSYITSESSEEVLFLHCTDEETEVKGNEWDLGLTWVI